MFAQLTNFPSLSLLFIGSFRPLGEVLMNDLTDTQKERLVNHVTKAIERIHPSDLVMLLPLILNNAAIQEAVFKTVFSFVRNELRLEIID